MYASDSMEEKAKDFQGSLCVVRMACIAAAVTCVKSLYPIINACGAFGSLYATANRIVHSAAGHWNIA